MGFEFSHFPSAHLVPALRGYPAIVGRMQGRTPELFVCGLHFDRFLKNLPPADLWGFIRQGTELRADGGVL